MSNAIKKYLELDKNLEYFKDNNIRWSQKFNEPVATFMLSGFYFDKLLGKRESVPKRIPGYAYLPDMVEKFHAAISCDFNIAISGPAGTGKSEFVEGIAALLNRPFFVADFHEDYRPDSLFGEYKPTEDGKLAWKNGPVTEGLLNKGAIVLLDECNMAPPGVLACAHRTLAGGTVFLHNKLGKAKEVAVKNFSTTTFVMACNALNDADEAGSYVDVKLMNRAFLDRWGSVIKAGYPTEKQEKTILLTKIRLSYPDQFDNLLKTGLDKFIEKLIKVAGKIRSQIQLGNLDTSFSVRRTVALCKLGVYYKFNVGKILPEGVCNREDHLTGKTMQDLFISEFGAPK